MRRFILVVLALVSFFAAQAPASAGVQCGANWTQWGGFDPTTGANRGGYPPQMRNNPQAIAEYQQWLNANCYFNQTPPRGMPQGYYNGGYPPPPPVYYQQNGYGGGNAAGAFISGAIIGSAIGAAAATGR